MDLPDPRTVAGPRPSWNHTHWHWCFLHLCTTTKMREKKNKTSLLHTWMKHTLLGTNDHPCVIMTKTECKIRNGHRYRPEIPDPGLELQLEVLGFFPTIKIFVIRQVCVYCDLINMHETPHGTWRLWTHFVCVCFCVCGWQKPEHPNWSSVADDAITRGSIGALGSPLYICGNGSTRWYKTQRHSKYVLSHIATLSQFLRTINDLLPTHILNLFKHFQCRF